MFWYDYELKFFFQFAIHFHYPLSLFVAATPNRYIPDLKLLEIFSATNLA
jgi:hypothetical protein